MALSLKGIARKYLNRTPPFSVRDVLSMPSSGGTVRSRLESIASKEHSFSWKEDCNGKTYGITAKYLQIWSHIVVRIRLDFDPDIPDATRNNLMNRWRNSIQTAWSNKWGCGATGESTCKLTFEVQWTANDPHHVVNIDEYPPPPPPPAPPPEVNAGRWFDNTSGNAAAHEFGHLLGNRDENTTQECPNRNPVNTGTIMDSATSRCFPERLMTRFANSIDSQIIQIPDYTHDPTRCT